MPSAITHQLIAEETLNRLPPEARKAVEAARDEYFLGCQGPDFLFFYRIGCKSEYNFGKFLHRYRVYDVFSLFLQAVGGGDGAPKFSREEHARALGYVLGYITHYCADSAFHPFVYNYLEANRCEKREHQQMENDWDVYFLRELRGREAEKFSFGFSAKNIIKGGAVARLFGFLADRLEREPVTSARFGRGLKNFVRYLKFFHKRCYRSQKRWQRAEKIFHGKRFLSRLYPRKDPAPEYIGGEHFPKLSEGKGRNADELFEYAVSLGGELIPAFLRALEEHAPLPRAEFQNGLLTGKPVD